MKLRNRRGFPDVPATSEQDEQRQRRLAGKSWDWSTEFSLSDELAAVVGPVEERLLSLDERQRVTALAALRDLCGLVDAFVVKYDRVLTRRERFAAEVGPMLSRFGTVSARHNYAKACLERIDEQYRPLEPLTPVTLEALGGLTDMLTAHVDKVSARLTEAARLPGWNYAYEPNEPPMKRDPEHEKLLRNIGSLSRGQQWAVPAQQPRCILLGDLGSALIRFLVAVDETLAPVMRQLDRIDEAAELSRLASAHHEQMLAEQQRQAERAEFERVLRRCNVRASAVGARVLPGHQGSGTVNVCVPEGDARAHRSQTLVYAAGDVLRLLFSGPIAAAESFVAELSSKASV